MPRYRMQYKDAQGKTFYSKVYSKPRGNDFVHKSSPAKLLAPEDLDNAVPYAVIKAHQAVSPSPSNASSSSTVVGSESSSVESIAIVLLEMKAHRHASPLPSSASSSSTVVDRDAQKAARKIIPLPSRKSARISEREKSAIPQQEAPATPTTVKQQTRECLPKEQIKSMRRAWKRDWEKEYKINKKFTLPYICEWINLAGRRAKKQKCC